MCDYNKEYLDSFAHGSAKSTITSKLNGDFVLTEKDFPVDKKADKIVWWAADPADHLQSFDGSGLPFPNAELAYGNAVNKGVVAVTNGQYAINMYLPNAFYIDLGTTYVPPYVNLQVFTGEEIKTFAHQISQGIPYRTLTWAPPPGTAPRDNSEWYTCPDQPVGRSQEQILRSYAFPKTNVYAPDYWGGKPCGN